MIGEKKLALNGKKRKWFVETLEKRSEWIAEKGKKLAFEIERSRRVVCFGYDNGFDLGSERWNCKRKKKLEDRSKIERGKKA